MLPEMLNGSTHDQKAPVSQFYLENLTVIVLAPEPEIPFLPEAQARDHRIDAQLFFVIGMPANAVIPVAVTVEQHGIEPVSGCCNDHVPELYQQRRPWLRTQFQS